RWARESSAWAAWVLVSSYPILRRHVSDSLRGAIRRAMGEPEPHPPCPLRRFRRIDGGEEGTAGVAWTGVEIFAVEPGRKGAPIVARLEPIGAVVELLRETRRIAGEELA